MIYQYLVVVNQEDDPSATMSLLLAASPSIASQRLFNLKKSGLSIPRTCHQINLEAFRIGSLVSQESFEVHQFHNCDPRIFYLHNNGYISCRYKKMDPNATSAFSLLFECKNLRTIYMEMKHAEEIMHYNILRSSIAGLFTKYRGWDLHYWYALRSEKPILEYGIPFFYSPWKIYQALVSSGRLKGREVFVIVDMNPSPSRQPFPKARLGKLPQKLRTQIYHELVAIPPIHTGRRLSTRDLRAGKGDLDRALTPPPPSSLMLKSAQHMPSDVRRGSSYILLA